ncbi:MAG: ATP-binding protein [Patescibacteria group bacterium]
MDLVQLEQAIYANNPHWENPKIYDEILKYKREIFDWFWKNLTSHNLILTLSGPRRVGKSYIFKQLIASLIEKEQVPPENILYFSFNSTMDDNQIVSDLVKYFLNKVKNLNGGKVYIFFDEVQFISSWTDQVKSFYDRELPIKFCVTGSTSLFSAKKSRESLLGRILKASLPPLSYREYLKFSGFNQNVDKKAVFLEFLPYLKTEFYNYLVFGQYPELIVDKKINHSEYLAGVADQLINYDVPYVNNLVDRADFSNVVKTLSFELANEVSVSKIAAGLNMDRRTVKEYIQILEEVGYFSLCYNDFYKKIRAKLSSNKKIYAFNLNLALSINGLGKDYLSESRMFGHYFENYVYLRLREKYKEVEYYSDGRKEVDFITKDNVWEVKSGVFDDTEKYLEIAKKLNKKLIFVTREEMESGKDFDKIPAYLL